MIIRTYSEMRQLDTFRERFEYLKLNGQVGKDTFGFDRIFNQNFYRSKEWKRVRNQVILRDNGCDLGCPDREIQGRIMIHHMNPISVKDISEATDYLLDPNYLVCVSHETHNAIHYGDLSKATSGDLIERQPNDMCPWKH